MGKGARQPSYLSLQKNFAVLQDGIEPSPPDFQSGAQTLYATGAWRGVRVTIPSSLP
jgi:hypothetical protein